MKNVMDKITPLDSYGKNEFRHSAHRLIGAQRELNQAYHGQPDKRDIIPDYNAVVAWSTVTCAYSGIEQAMKCLLQMRGAYIDKPQSKGGHRHHDIGKLFQALASEEQDVLNVSYAIYRSLHYYIPLETVDSFLQAIDDGYPTWRYFLLEGEMPPTTHAGAMLEIWSTLAAILRARALENDGLNTVKHRIEFRLRELHIDAAKNECNDLEQINSMIGWRQSDVFLDLNQYIDLLLNDAVDQPLQITGPTPAMPDVLSIPRVLNRFVGKAKENVTDNDFMFFLSRAQQGGLFWNASKNRFDAR